MYSPDTTHAYRQCDSAPEAVTLQNRIKRIARRKRPLSSIPICLDTIYTEETHMRTRSLIHSLWYTRWKGHSTVKHSVAFRGLKHQLLAGSTQILKGRTSLLNFNTAQNEIRSGHPSCNNMDIVCYWKQTVKHNREDKGQMSHEAWLTFL